MTRIAVVTSGFPRRSETFALHELLALQEADMLAAVFATKGGDGLSPHPDLEGLRVPVRFLPSGAAGAQAAALAELLAEERVDAVHGYFAHTPAVVAASAARMLDLPYGFSVHARDARKVDASQLEQLVRDAACVVACNDDVARDVPIANGGLIVVPHGVDLGRFAASPAPRRKPPQILAVGRLVEKKGFDVLVAAAALLGGSVQIRIVGDGPERERLQQRIAEERVGDTVSLVQGQAHDALPQEYAEADIVVVPSIRDSSGDRDGLPNVVLEAMASARPVVATRAGAIPSAVEHRSTGLLVQPREPASLARAIRVLACSTELRERMGTAARLRAERLFDLSACTDRFVRVLEDAYA